jgi:hypothetical protein
VESKQLNFVDSELKIDAARWIRDFHETIHHSIEELFEGAWRVTKIIEQSKTIYQPTLVTRRDSAPDYILTEVLATFDVESTENGPLDTVLENPFTFETRETTRPMRRLHCKVQLLSSGYLRITDSSMAIPQR